MVIRRRRGRVFVAQAIVSLAALFLSLNLLAARMASGSDFCFPALERDAQAGHPAPRHPFPVKQLVAEGADGENTGLFTWNTEEVDAPKYFKRLSSRAIAMDANNRPHIVYGGDHLYHAYHDGTAWQYETIDPSPNAGWDASMAFDASGHAHISYVGEDHTLKHATNASGAWVMATVDNNGNVGWFSSIALDTSGHAHISYMDWTTKFDSDLKYATNASGSWATVTVDSNGDVGWNTSIALDPSGKAHISYYNPLSYDLMYATGGQ